MKLTIGAFRIELLPRRRAGDEDWVRVQLVASALGFGADFQAWLQLEDLRVFEREVETMYSTLGGSADLSSAEPDSRVSLAATTMGQILGTYSFQSAVKAAQLEDRRSAVKQVRATPVPARSVQTLGFICALLTEGH